MLVYVPKQCCVESCGYLLGCIDIAHSVCCVTALIPFSEIKCRFSAAVNPLPHCTYGVIGTWASNSDLAFSHVRSGVNHSCDTEHLLLLWKRADKLFVEWNYNNAYLQWRDGTDEFVIILYDSLQFSNSVVVHEKGHTNLTDEAVLSNVHAILQAFYCHKQFCDSVEAMKRTVSVVDFTRREPDVTTEISSTVFQFAAYFVSLVFAFSSAVCSFRLDTLTNDYNEYVVCGIYHNL